MLSRELAQIEGETSKGIRKGVRGEEEEVRDKSMTTSQPMLVVVAS